MKHILVTGANGFIGSHLVKKLLELKQANKWPEEIVCLVRKTSHLAALEKQNVRLILGDLREPETLIPAVKGAKYIYHLGAELHTISLKNFLETNTRGTENLLNAAVTHAKDTLKRFLFVSSQAAGGPAAINKPKTEKDPPSEPVSWYSKSKLEAEKIAKKFFKKIPITIVRPTSVYGERDPGFVSIYKALEKRIHPLTGLKKRYTGMVYAPDLVEGFITAATSPKTLSQTYYLNNPRNYTVKEMVKIMAKAIGKPWGITLPIPIFIFKFVAIFSELIFLFTRKKPLPSRDKVRDLSQIYWLCTAKKAQDDFGWVAKTSLNDGVTATYSYLQSEDLRLKKMTLDTKWIIWLKYVFLSMSVGVIIETLAAFGKVYLFTPGWLVFLVIPGLWGLTFGSVAMVTRTKSGFIQFLPGFIILFGAELLNHYYLHKWIFYYFFQEDSKWKYLEHSLYGIENPFIRAAVLGVATGFLIPLINGIMKQIYKHQQRVG